MTRDVAIHQMAQVAAMVAALYSGDLALLGRALDDRIAEPARAPLLPGFLAAKRAALEAGALGASISGSGPTAFALAGSHSAAERIGAAMTAAYAAAGIGCVVRIDSVDATGARVVSGRGSLRMSGPARRSWQRCAACGHELDELARETRCPTCGGLLEIVHAPPAGTRASRCSASFAAAAVTAHGRGCVGGVALPGDRASDGGGAGVVARGEHATARAGTRCSSGPGARGSCSSTRA